MSISCCLLLLAGCIEDAPEIGAESAELIGGTVTAARPEVGIYINGGGFGCTATLISPTVVLTAAHCLSPQYTATSALPGAGFAFTDSSGVSQWYPIDRVHSFGTHRYQFVPFVPNGGATTNDVALLHLTRRVPTTEAIPADLALQEPAIGVQSTTFGFGCTVRGLPSDWLKRFLTFTTGLGTSTLCPGDSGGPVVYGGVNDGGAIWGVNSDYYENYGGVWSDLFGVVPFHRKQIEDVMRAWDGPDEVGWDRPGMDYLSVFSFSPAGCRSMCQNDARCAAFTWVPSGTAGQCFLKEGVPEPYLAWNNAVVSGLAARYEFATNRAGGDYGWFYAERAEHCAAYCGRDHACKAWTYVAPSGSGLGTCWLKDTAPGTSSCPSCTSGVVQRDLEVGYDRPGYDYGVVNAASANECADHCAKDARCEAYTHTTAPSHNCFLKDAVGWATPAAGMTSGVRAGVETNTDRAGGDYRSFTTPQLSPTVCQAACAAESPCLAWTYAPPPPAHLEATCWLKSSIPARSSASGLVSGLKGLEMAP